MGTVEANAYIAQYHLKFTEIQPSISFSNHKKKKYYADRRERKHESTDQSTNK